MMAFPLAHPAAVLPLRRWFKWLSFPALVIGSIVPDAGYLLPRQFGELSHQFLGSILFGLPLGALLLAAFYAVRTPVVVRMSAPVRRSVLPVCQRAPVLWITVLSLLIGICTHIVWDSVTHKDGWIVEQFPLLLTPILQFDGRTARVCNLLWYISSFLGAGWLFLAFEKWKHNALAPAGHISGNGKDTLQDAAFLSILVVAVSLVHHLIRNPIGYIMTAAFCFFLGVLFIVRMEDTEKTVH
jgi:hypothetical protein